MARVAVIGLGAMGQRIATRMLDRGHQVQVWSRNREATAALEQKGARPVGTAAQAAELSELAIVMVSDGKALQSVTEGPDGVLSAETLPALLQMSTVAISDVARLSAALPAGAELIDSPVLGSLAEAESGTLRLLIGADDSVYGKWEGILQDLGAPELIGPPGSGTAAKLVANSALFGVVGLLGETLELAKHLGLGTDDAFRVLSYTPLAAQAERRRVSITTGEYPPRFTLSLARKDADLIAAAGADGGADLRLADAVRSLLLDAEEAGWGPYDYTAVLAHLTGQRPPTT